MTLRANVDAAFTLTFLWPRIMLRTMMGCEVALQKSV